MNKILLIGETCIDHSVWCENTRNSPEDVSVPVFKILKEDESNGMVDIVSHHLHLFKCKHTKLSNNEDEIIKTRLYKTDKQVIRIDRDTDVSLSNESIEWLINNINSFDSIVISDYGKGLMDQRIIDLICKSGKRIYLDPHPNNDLEKYYNLFAVKLNDKELQTFTGLDNIKKGAQLIKGMTNAKHVFVTLNKNGIFHLDENNETHFTASQVKNEVKQLSGAGDVVLASIVTDMEQQTDIVDVLANSMKRAAVYVEGRDFNTPSWPNLDYV